ncbi:Dyp-type peroxidase [Echria macrotheca]|uniref:Dyp-type peroxidase n=1 Tax=Echria macrotheca TaxID=438768 RepID=A0AAJ0BFU3_9PEZI|nr:Dyp-type peroxidase [Echria macrotheca]
MASDAKAEKLEDVLQGDIWSRGFPKYHETYYLFQINPLKTTEFAKNLKSLVIDKSQVTNKPSLISSLKMVKGDWEKIDAEKKRAEAAHQEPQKLPVANALIAFTFKGLKALQAGLPKKRLSLATVQMTDKAFSGGMKADADALSDPSITETSSLFANTEVIHGLLKVAGNSREMVNDLLNEIKKALKHHDKVIEDVPGGDKGRIDGATREGDHRGKEHFGFEDAISQPLMKDIDTIPTLPSGAFSMVTDPEILMVTEETHRPDPALKRPDWMHQGSFLVFRKLQQDVDAFNALCDQNYANLGCQNASHLSAKLMGRWPSGAPITMPEFATVHADGTKEEMEKRKRLNDFSYEPVDRPPSTGRLCPLVAHIRKTNPRERVDSNSGDIGHRLAKIIRNGIPYGPDWKQKGDSAKRGLLFACYQGSIDDAFRFMQMAWCNEEKFPPFKAQGGVGIDPIVGQHQHREKMKSLILEGDEKKGYLSLPVNPRLVTFQGGEYFFAPSIKALSEVLSAD